MPPRARPASVSGPAPALSVALSVYNGARFLDAAIASVRVQTFTDFEFLILDDGSTDSSRAIIGAHALADPRIRLIACENRGLIVSLNQLISEARAPIIVRMDADDLCAPTRFAHQIAFLAQHPAVGVVGTATTDIDERGAPWPLHAAPFLTDHAGIVSRLESGGPSLCHPSVALRRDVVLGVGGYHAAFKHCEDLDLWLRLASVTRLANIVDPLLQYRHYAGQVSSRHATEQQVGAEVARLAYRARAAGRPDPTAQLSALPPVAGLDALFGQPGVAASVRAAVAQSILYSRAGLTDQGFDMVLAHIADGGARAQPYRNRLWRTAARLLTFREPVRAARLVTAMLAH